MNLFFLQVQNDSIAQATGAVVQNTVAIKEISVLEFVTKGGLFLIPIALLLFYTLYIIMERWMYISKRSKIDPNLTRDVREALGEGELKRAVAFTERSNSASGSVLREGILTRMTSLNLK